MDLGVPSRDEESFGRFCQGRRERATAEQIAKYQKENHILELKVKRLKEENKEAWLVANANKLRNTHLNNALEVAEAFLRGRSGTKKVLAQIEELKGE